MRANLKSKVLMPSEVLGREVNQQLSIQKWNCFGRSLSVAYCGTTRPQSIDTGAIIILTETALPL